MPITEWKDHFHGAIWLVRVEPEGTTSWGYDTARMGVGKLAVVEQRDAANDLLFKQETAYDGYGRSGRSTTTIPNDDGTLNVLSTFTYYDRYGRVARTVQPGGFEIDNPS